MWESDEQKAHTLAPGGYLYLRMDSLTVGSGPKGAACGMCYR
jgi:hypothetical protein